MAPPASGWDLWLDQEEGWLAPYAMRTRASRGRRHPEPPHEFRTPFQRDRERIVHSSAFRRITGKTQVLVASVNDHHRTRLTHSLEVAQVARTVARRLRLNEDLIEAIALAHDIGHPPFGHAGEQALDECLAALGGFDHNLYGLRRVDELEERYPTFPGLNLTFELREAFVRHSKKRTGAATHEFEGIGGPLIEAQVVDVVDSIVYDTHDLDDALGLGFISLDELQSVDLWQRAARTVQATYPGLNGYAYRIATVRELLALQVTELLDDTTRRLSEQKLRSIDDVRACQNELVGFGSEISSAKRELEQFLHERVYHHHRVLRMTAGGKRILRALFAEYLANPELLPDRHRRRWVGSSQFQRDSAATQMPGRRPVLELELVVGDYLAGMTDRFAQQEYRRLFSPMNES